nr:MAG TPA: hypothetical protein [Caudoviricetes sp.]
MFILLLDSDCDSLTRVIIEDFVPLVLFVFRLNCSSYESLAFTRTVLNA